MKRDDFVFIIGFQGDQAIVDGQSRRKYGKLDTRGLADAGQFRAALRSAVFSGDTAEGEHLVHAFNQASGSALRGLEDLKKLLGVYQSGDMKFKVKVI